MTTATATPNNTKWRRLTIHCDAALTNLLAERASAGIPESRIVKDLAHRAVSILSAELSTMGGRFDLDEMAIILHSLHGTDAEPMELWSIVDSQMTYEDEGLIAKLQALTPGQSWALVDLAERINNSGSEIDARTLRRLGLVVKAGE